MSHRLCRWHLAILLEPSEEAFDAFEDIDERILARSNVLCHLSNGFTRVDTIRVITDQLSEQATNVFQSASSDSYRPTSPSTQKVLINAPYSSPRRDPPLQELPQDVFSPQPDHSVQRRRESHAIQNERLWHISTAHADLAQRGELYRNGGGGEGGEDVLAQKQYSAGMSVAVYLRTKGLSASAISPVPDLPIPDKNKKSAAPLVPGARTELEDVSLAELPVVE
ncbi:hypothetical protein EDB85DRAFT_2293154 [Lactarius pseudohatsudake]|nr:hypothetical protein EDB85DRAFT_2293154 [Lactarius pseudohatsudake]